MLILGIVNKKLIAHEVKNGKFFHIENELIYECSLNTPYDKTILVLDYDAYFNLTERRQIFIAYPFLEKLTFICSSHEVIGGYLQSLSPELDGDLTVIDFELEQWHTYTIAFNGHCYYCKDTVVAGNKSKGIARLARNTLNLSESQLLSFENFLGLEAMDDKCYGQIIKESLNEFEKGAKEYDDILAVLDIPEWAHIKMNDLLEFKTQFFKNFEVDFSQPLYMNGWFGYLFTERESLPDGMEKNYGAMHLIKNRHRFYPKLQTDISLGVFCYPNWVKVPVLEAQCDYHNYSVPKSLTLVDTGSIEIYRGEERLPVKTGHRLERIQLEISLDGNQNLLLVAGKEIHLIT